MTNLSEGKNLSLSIPLRINLALDNISSPNRPPPLYVSVHDGYWPPASLTPSMHPGRRNTSQTLSWCMRDRSWSLGSLTSPLSRSKHGRTSSVYSLICHQDVAATNNLGLTPGRSHFGRESIPVMLAGDENIRSILEGEVEPCCLCIFFMHGHGIQR
jgi:hypothetical protein